MKKSDKNQSSKRHKVLLVDDEQEHLIALENLLDSLEVELFPVRSGGAALSLLAKEDFSLALIDVDMPEMDGYALAEIICEDERTCSIPFIFILNPGAQHIKTFRGFEKGTFTFVSKPFNADLLRNKAKYFIEKFRHEEELKSTKKVLRRHIQELEKAYDELKSFSYSVSHDLRAPLRVISGYSNILIEDYSSQMDSEALKVINTIVRNTKKMSVLIDEILNFARLARQDKHLQQVDMNEKFKSIFEELTEHIQNRKIKLVMHPLTPAFADHALIRRLLTNLIGNSIKYTAPRKDAIIEVGGEQQGNEYIYYVKDNGVGFDSAYKDKLFGVFQRLHKDTEFEGTGIGLAIAHKVIQHHGGRVWAEGSPGKGATFYFTLEKQKAVVTELF